MRKSDQALQEPLLPLLVLDCSSEWCTLALLDEDGVSSFNEPLGRNHSARLLTEIETLKQERQQFGALGAVGVVVGPGSFTGVRIAVATAQALAYAHGCPVVRLDALELLARSWQQRTEATTATVVCARRSRSELYYFGAYELDRDESRCLGELVLLDDPAGLRDWLSQFDDLDLRWVGAGPAWLPKQAFVEVDPLPEALLSLAAAQLNAGASVTAAEALPLYLNADSPWQPKP